MDEIDLAMTSECTEQMSATKSSKNKKCSSTRHDHCRIKLTVKNRVFTQILIFEDCIRHSFFNADAKL